MVHSKFCGLRSHCPIVDCKCSRASAILQVESLPKQTFDLREKLNESRKTRGNNNENYVAGGDDGQAKVFSPKSQKRNEKRTNARDGGRRDRKPRGTRSNITFFSKICI